MAKIMVVDDDTNIRENIKVILWDEGHDVDTASNADEAWNKLSEEHVDLILLDIMMPGMTVDKFIEKILLGQGPGDIPKVLFISGVGFLDKGISKDAKIKHLTTLITKLKGDAVEELPLEKVVVDFLEKPFGRVDLLTKIEKILGD